MLLGSSKLTCSQGSTRSHDNSGWHRRCGEDGALALCHRQRPPGCSCRRCLRHLALRALGPPQVRGRGHLHELRGDDRRGATRLHDHRDTHGHAFPVREVRAREGPSSLRREAAHAFSGGEPDTLGTRYSAKAGESGWLPQSLHRHLPGGAAPGAGGRAGRSDEHPGGRLWTGRRQGRRAAAASTTMPATSST